MHAKGHPGTGIDPEGEPGLRDLHPHLLEVVVFAGEVSDGFETIAHTQPAGVLLVEGQTPPKAWVSRR